MSTFRCVLFAAGALLLPSVPVLASPTDTIPNCPGDRAVWVNEGTHVYHLKDDKFFGHTRNGKYACEAAAKAEGAHLPKGK